MIYGNDTFLIILQKSIIEGKRLRKRLRVYTLHNSKKAVTAD